MLTRQAELVAGNPSSNSSAAAKRARTTRGPTSRVCSSSNGAQNTGAAKKQSVSWKRTRPNKNPPRRKGSPRGIEGVSRETDRVTLLPRPVLADGVAVGRDHEGRRRTGGNGSPRRPPPTHGYAPTREAAMAACSPKVAGRVAPMTSHHEPTPLPALVWAVVFTILLVAAVAIFVLVVLR